MWLSRTPPWQRHNESSRHSQKELRTERKKKTHGDPKVS
jgi:hypothetical protein